MFPSINLNKAIALAAQNLYVKLNRKVQISKIIKLFEYCTKNLTFEFDGKYYKQINGIQMGSPLAPILAEIYMNDFENNLLL